MNKFGFSKKDWESAIKEGTNVLVDYAKKRQMVTYTDFVNQIKSVRFPDPHDIRLGHFLGEISMAEAKAGRGMLSALVVHKQGDYQPGRGFYDLANELGYKDSDIEKLWVQQVKKVFGTWSKSP